MAHTNHCVHENLVEYNERFADAIYGQSFDRKARAEGRPGRGAVPHVSPPAPRMGRDRPWRPATR